MAKLRYDLHIENDTSNDDSSLVLMRFPAMRSQFENPADLVQLSIKPKSMKFKLDVALDSGSSGYCQEKAQILASKSIPKTFTSNCVNKNFYTSTKIPVEDGELFICKVINDKLICRPISHLLTMRSDFSHFDLRDEVDPKDEIKPVSVKFAAPDRQSAPMRNQGNQQETDDSLDKYQQLNYKTITSREAVFQRATLFGQRLPKVKLDPDAEPVEQKPHVVFIPDVKPKIEKFDIDDIYSSEITSAQTSLKKSNQIKNIVKDCLLKAKIVSFEEIYHVIKGNNNRLSDQIPINNKDILDALGELALLVQGNWAIKSEILYGDSSERDCTDVTGISINLFIAARDYLLWLFTQNRIVSRLEYSGQVKMPNFDILELFNQLATFRKDIRKWELKLPTDNKFLERFPDIVQRQATFWKVRRANKLSIFNG